MTRLLTVIGAVALLTMGGFVLQGRSGGDMPANPLVGAANAQDAAEVDISSVIEMVQGEVTELEVICGERYVALGYDPEMIWSVNRDWGDCDVRVFGDNGARFKMIEYR